MKTSNYLEGRILQLLERVTCMEHRGWGWQHCHLDDFARHQCVSMDFFPDPCVLRYILVEKHLWRNVPHRKVQSPANNNNKAGSHLISTFRRCLSVHLEWLGNTRRQHLFIKWAGQEWWQGLSDQRCAHHKSSVFCVWWQLYCLDMPPTEGEVSRHEDYCTFLSLGLGLMQSSKLQYY